MSDHPAPPAQPCCPRCGPAPASFRVSQWTASCPRCGHVYPSSSDVSIYRPPSPEAPIGVETSDDPAAVLRFASRSAARFVELVDLDAPGVLLAHEASVLIGLLAKVVRRSLTAPPPPDAAPCRRCGDCQNFSHHWLGFADDGDAEPTEGDPDYCCKHCPAVGDECEACGGNGAALDHNGDAMGPDCCNCDGEGVIERKPAPA